MIRSAPPPTAARVACAFALLACLGACRSAYYATMAKLGVEKRELLADRVEDGMEAQEEARERFRSTFERLVEVAGVELGELEEVYGRLEREYRRSEDQAEEVRKRSVAIERVAADLFEEWEEEIGEISSADLQRQSRAMLEDTRGRYAKLRVAMRAAEESMEPVLAAFRDQVLFLKHNLNAQAVAALDRSVESVEAEVAALVERMEASIAEAAAFLAAMES